MLRSRGFVAFTARELGGGGKRHDMGIEQLLNFISHIELRTCVNHSLRFWTCFLGGAMPLILRDPRHFLEVSTCIKERMVSGAPKSYDCDVSELELISPFEARNNGMRGLIDVPFEKERAIKALTILSFLTFRVFERAYSREELVPSERRLAL